MKRTSIIAESRRRREESAAKLKIKKIVINNLSIDAIAIATVAGVFIVIFALLIGFGYDFSLHKGTATIFGSAHFFGFGKNAKNSSILDEWSQLGKLPIKYPVMYFYIASLIVLSLIVILAVTNQLLPKMKRKALDITITTLFIVALVFYVLAYLIFIIYVTQTLKIYQKKYIVGWAPTKESYVYFVGFVILLIGILACFWELKRGQKNKILIATGKAQLLEHQKKTKSKAKNNSAIDEKSGELFTE